jgi:nucleoside-diphosphate-sugar epimerase
MLENNVLITGGAGYIGSILTKTLLDNNFKVTILDNFRYEQNSLLEYCTNKNFSIIKGDCREQETLSHALKDKNFIIHLAAIVGAPLCDKEPTTAKTTNFDAAKLLLSLRTIDQKILFPCTNSGYGIGERNKYCTEESALNPISLYAKTKVDAERAILDSKNSISFRLATVFGVSPRMRLDLLVNDFVYKAMKDKKIILFESHFKRNYLHIRDVARVFLHGINNFSKMKNQVYNVGLSNANLSKLELCQTIKKFIPDFTFEESPIGKDPDKRDYIVSNEKIEKTGFMPEHTLEMGILELMKSYPMLNNSKFSNI